MHSFCLNAFMKNALKKLFPFALIILLNIECKSNPKKENAALDETVIAEGVAAIFENNLGRAKDEALLDAKRNAVRQVLGSLIEGKTSLYNGSFVEMYVKEQTRGFISSYEVLDQKAVSNIEYKVRIKATVKKGFIENGIIPALENQGHPKLLLLVFDEFEGKIITDSNAEIELGKKFVRAGFTIIDNINVKKVFMGLKNIEFDARLFSDSLLAAARESAINEGAQLLVYGKNKISNTGKIRNSKLYSIHSYLQIKIIEIVSKHLLTSQQGEGAFAHINPKTGAFKATLESAQSAAKGVIQDLARKWDFSKPNDVTLIIKKATFSQVSKITDSLKTIRGVEQVFMQSANFIEKEESHIPKTLSQPKNARLQVTFFGSATTLAYRLHTAIPQKINISRIDQNYIELTAH